MGKFFPYGRMLPLLLVFATLMAASCPVKKLIQGYVETPITQNSGGKLKGRNSSIIHDASLPCTINNSQQDAIYTPAFNTQAYPLQHDFLALSGSSIFYYLSFLTADVPELYAIDQGFASRQLPLFLAHRRLLI